MNCHSLAKDICLWALDKNIHLSAEHLPGSKNTVADGVNRVFDLNTEWTLACNVFAHTENQFGQFSIDLFA